MSYRVTLAVAWICWVSAAVLVALRAFREIPQEMTGVAVVLVGISIATSVSLSRMRLGRTIEQVFEAGMILARKVDELSEVQKNNGTPTKE